MLNQCEVPAASAGMMTSSFWADDTQITLLFGSGYAGLGSGLSTVRAFPCIIYNVTALFPTEQTPNRFILNASKLAIKQHLTSRAHYAGDHGFILRMVWRTW